MLVNFKKTAILALLVLGVLLASFTTYQTNHTGLLTLTDQTPVWDVLDALGQIKTNTVNTEIKGVSVEKGASIVYNGYSTKQDGSGKTKIQSPYFKCTACHNVEREYQDLTDINPKDKLDYAIKNDLPFLQASTFHGIVNRTNFYNDDYQKKYGSVPSIKASYDDIRTAIQFCATQCAQGRALEDWELESILAFFWTKELKIKDLALSSEESTTVQTALKSNEKTTEAIQALEANYLKKAPAHFAEHDLEYKALTAEEKNDKARQNNGKELYNRGCLHCHGNQRYSFLNLENNSFDFEFLSNKTKKGGFQSIYKITRHGTYSLNGKKAYMPQYPIEKMSDKQLQDLRIYIEMMAN